MGLFLALATSTFLKAETRPFTDVNGRVLRGELIDYNGEEVKIKREDGQTFTLKVSAFSAADQAYFKHAVIAAPAGPATKTGTPPKPKDVRTLPFCATMKAVKLNPKLKDMFDELRVTASNRIRIHGKKEKDTGKVDGKVVYHNGKLALFPAVELSGKVTSRLAFTVDVRRHFAVLELGDKLVTEELKLAENKPQNWSITQSDGKTILKVSAEGEATVTVTAPTAQVTGAGFAATARWVGNEVDMSVDFDEPQK